MAGGIDWFRWHHGSVTDPKFALVARRAGASLPDVLAVWAYLLEHASAADSRGTFESIDFEAWDCLFGFPDGRTQAIHDAMCARQLIAEGAVSSWEKRQPKREREGDNSTERSRNFRQRQKEEQDAKQHQESECNAMQRQETPREEERREEKKEEKYIPPDLTVGTPQGEKPAKPAKVKAAMPDKPDDVCAEAWEDWTAHRRKAKASITTRVIDKLRESAGRAGMSLEQAMDWTVQQNHQGFYPPKSGQHAPAQRPAPGSYAERRENQLIGAAILTGTYRPQDPQSPPLYVMTLEHDDGKIAR